MQQILSIWSALDMRRKVVVVLATLAMFAATLALGRMAARPGMSLLYSGLESAAAGEVVSALEQRGVLFDVRGGAIYVENSARDELRMTLASEGLPANTTQGYELLDSLSGFGTTSQMFDAAYWRAKEGELARTIIGSPYINSARVHIAHAGSNPFQRQLQPTASVTIASTGGGLPPRQAQALRFLIASAVAGLSPDDVAVIDGTNGLVGATNDTGAQTQDNRAEFLRQAVQRLLEARVGVGNAVVEISVEAVTESESIVERVFDPAGRVAISTDTEERNTDSKNATSGQVTVASNLPSGDAGQNQGSSNRNSETRERVNYEVSETQREINREPGAIRRLTVAVLVNGFPSVGTDGETQMSPRSDEELVALRELVSSAVGFDETRGDVITLKSMIFQPMEPLGSGPTDSFFTRLSFDAISLVQMGVFAIVAIILGVFVVRPILSRKPLHSDLSTPQIPVDLATKNATGAPVLTGEIDESPNTNFLEPDKPLSLPATESQQADAVERLRALISDRQEETVEILRNWLEDREERA